jgi:hypothetical protein
MDSKMEAMRALIEKDPQSEGLFTAYSSSLERVALRKSRYLDPPVPAEAVTPSAVTPPVSAPVVSAPPVPAVPKPLPANGSLFGDKLLQALHDERK